MEGMRLGHIHPTAIISDSARMGRNVTIGAHTIIYDNAEIGDDTVIGPNCILGEPLAAYYHSDRYTNPALSIGPNTLIRSGSVIYASSSIGAGFECGHRVTVREEATIGRNCRVGTLSDIQGYCQIGDYVRLHSNVFVSQKSLIGDFVWIFPHAVLTNDPHPPSNEPLGVTVEDYAVIAAMAIVLAGVRVGRDALIGAMANVRYDVPPEAVVVGNPAKQVATIHEIKSRFSGQPVYPWREHFDRGMPWEGIGYHAWWEQEQGRNEGLARRTTSPAA